MADKKVVARKAKEHIGIKDFVTAVDFEIAGGCEYDWSCFGPDAYFMDWERKVGSKFLSAHIVYDSKTQVVYELEVWDGRSSDVWRLFLVALFVAIHIDNKKEGN
jgi:hypothetical protein